ncbi:MAG: FG-GAP-like repeat-containing protein, partial [Bacteroidia bacterium]
MLRFLFILVSALIINFQSDAQNVYFSLSNNAKFLKQNTSDTLKYPFVGGFQKPQFNKMDLNNDGQKDLVVFDGIGNKIFTYLWLNNSWVYAPKYEKIFPPISQWLKLLDYNCDGKEDIFTASGSAYAINTGEYVTSNSIRYYQNTSTGNTFSFIQKGNCLLHTNDGNDYCIEFMSIDLGVIDDINNDGKLDVLGCPSGSNRFDYYENIIPIGNNYCDSISFKWKVQDWGHFSYKVNSFGFNFAQASYYIFKKKKDGGSSFALLDIDADGDKDFIFGDKLFPTLIYVKNGKELTKLGRDSMIVEDTIFPRNTYRPLDMVWPTPYFKD